MKIGLSVTTAHPDDVEARISARWVVERAGAAAAAGFASFSVGDHHGTPGPYMQNIPILARCLAVLGPMPVLPLFLLPLWHPVLLAEQVGTLAALADGPVHPIFTAGAGADQFGSLGVSLSERRGRMEEALALLRRLFHEDSVTFEGRFWQLENVPVNPKPHVPPQFWIGGSAAVAVERAGRLGDVWLCAPGATLEEASASLTVYRQALDRAGRAQQTNVAAIRRDIYVGESDEEAESTAGPLLQLGYRGLPPDVPIVGGPERVSARLREIEALGFQHLLVRYLPVGQERILASIRRTGREVIPALAGAGGAP